MQRVQSLSEFLGTESSITLAENPNEQSIEEFCRGVLQSREYRQSIIDRITLGTLPAAIELRFYDYAAGKPKERIEHSGRIESISEVRRVIVRTSEQQEQEDEAHITQSVH